MSFISVDSVASLMKTKQTKYAQKNPKQTTIFDALFVISHLFENRFKEMRKNYFPCVT